MVQNIVKYALLFHNMDEYHDTGVCFTEISESTLAVDSAGRFSFIKGTFCFIPASKEAIDKDFEEMAAMFDRLTVLSVGEEMAQQAPNDYNLLLNMMETQGFKMRYLIVTHTSLLPIDNKASVYLKFHQTIHAELRKLEIRQILDKIPFDKRWFLCALKNYYLAECLKHNAIHIGRQNRIHHGTKQELFDTGRHVFSHRHIINIGGARYNSRDVDLMWDTLYGDLLAYFQQELNVPGRRSIVLRYIGVENYFFGRKVTRPWD